MKTLRATRQDSVIRNPTLAQRQQWHKEALGAAKLAKDIHPHVRRREEFRRHMVRTRPENVHPDYRHLPEAGPR